MINTSRLEKKSGNRSGVPVVLAQNDDSSLVKSILHEVLSVILRKVGYGTTSRFESCGKCPPLLGSMVEVWKFRVGNCSTVAVGKIKNRMICIA